MDRTLSRRTILATAGAALAAGSLPLGNAAGKARAVSMAMHIHGPFSEGLASFSAHFEQARKYGVDVIWWTDHDFRIAAFEHRQAVHFDGPSEPERGLDWTWSRHVEGAATAPVAEFVAAPHSPQDGTGTALRLFFTAVGSSDDHDATDWAANEEHDITYVWANSTSRADLLAALAKGAAWFTDLTHFRGTLDLRVGGVSQLGAVYVTKKPVTVDVVATDVPAGGKVEVVLGVADEAQAVPSTQIAASKRLTVSPGHYVRVQVRSAAGAVVGVSNPLWVLRKTPKRPIPAVRMRK
ncbi:hypothetical protein [Dactylosporangium salmoneum]|uniref:Uncharacterized protein n=1 Tax=Dactylosporangium salmoneum TaxID=53361 RepID=A0ABP5T4Q9_9ACTN